MRNIRIIPRLDIKGPKVIKGVHLECLRVVGDPGVLAKKYYDDGADELFYMDIVASLYGRKNLVDIVKMASENIFIPLTVGGGVSSLDDINNLLRAGADKVAINSHLMKNPDFANTAAKVFGSQCIVGSIEAKKMHSGEWLAFYNNGREYTGKDAVGWARELEDRGVGELLVTSIDQEGTKKGYDISLTAQISTKVRIPVIASGGAGSLQDIDAVVRRGHADAVAIATVLHFDELSIAQVKEYLHRAFALADSYAFVSPTNSDGFY